MYLQGDYNIDTFTGAVASCIMKWQVWCPNAIVVLVTPFPRWGLNTKQQLKSNNLTFRQLCEIELQTAKYMNTEIIDANAKCNINIHNFESCTQTDDIHPNEDGRKLYGRTLITELYNIYPKII